MLLAQAGSDAHGSLTGDSSGFSLVGLEVWEDAKRGIVSRKMFDKLHILLSPHSNILTCAVTAGRRHDSPIFKKMFKKIPKGTGNVTLDPAYLSKQNCHMIEEKGRMPFIRPKKNSVAKGYGSMAKMLRYCKENPDEFYDKYHQRSLVENAFSVIKERFGNVIRAKTELMRQLNLTLKCICYNLVC